MRERRLGLEVFLTDPDVPMDTNHLERALRVIPMGRKSWLFCSTKLDAGRAGIIQSLIVTCRLHGHRRVPELVQHLSPAFESGAMISQFLLHP